MINVDEVIDSMIASVASTGKPGQVPKIADNIVQDTDENFQVQTSHRQGQARRLKWQMLLVFIVHSLFNPQPYNCNSISFTY